MKPQPRYHPGDRIGGRYQVHKALMGGMGEVYLCLDLEEMYPYALKTFQERYLTNTKILHSAFEQEVKTWVALEEHPNIVRCFYMGILDNQPFMVLEWIAGKEDWGSDLRSWLQRGPLDVKLSLEIVFDICNGLLHAQTKQPGLVHRDLKPENILMEQGNLAKITDFGLATIVAQAELNVTQETPSTDNRYSIIGDKGIAGTLAYMAPEQWRGEPVDERTDIYALGCILYELLTGTPPFTVNSTTPLQMKTWLPMMQRAHEMMHVPPLPATFAPALHNLISDCMAKAPSERPADLHNLMSRLVEIYQKQLNQMPPQRPDPSNFNAVDYNNRGATYATLGEYERALADFGHVIVLEPTNDLAYYNRGGVYHILKDYKKALADYNQAIAINSTNAKTYSNRGNTYADLHEYKRALADFEQAIKLDDTDPKAYYNRGIIYKALHDYKRALADYDRAISIDPDDAKIYYNRGNIYSDLQDYECALSDYSKAIDIHPTYTKAYYERGEIYTKLQRYKQALGDYSKVIDIDPNDSQAYASRGRIYAELKEYEQALADFGRTIALNNNDAEAYYNRGVLYAAIQDYRLALLDYSNAIVLDPNYAKAYCNRGVAYTAIQEYERALADYHQAIILDPNDSLAYCGRGDIYTALQQYDHALEDYNKAIATNPSDAQAYLNRGNIFADLQQFDQALVDYTRAIDLDPNFAPAYVNKGVTLATLRHLWEALPYLDKAAQLGEQTGTQVAFLVRLQLGLETEQT